MIDTRATSNFISQSLAQELKLKVSNTPSYTMEVRTRQQTIGCGVCQGVVIEVQRVKIMQSFFLLELGGVDVVLGMDWLSSLGNILANFQKLTIRWMEKRMVKMIQGDPTLCKSKASWKVALKALKDDGKGYFITASEKGDANEVVQELPQAIQQLLGEFGDICKLPAGLPPPREHDHAINLKEGVAILHVRPYSYPHFQKNEIEKIIDEMLTVGIIRPSASPLFKSCDFIEKERWRVEVLCRLQDIE